MHKGFEMVPAAIAHHFAWSPDSRRHEGAGRSMHFVVIAIGETCGVEDHFPDVLR
ncbi:MAG: hypothetical protein RIS70_302 [Planctomycetota bacterium]|jgi:hypothetical protein